MTGANQEPSRCRPLKAAALLALALVVVTSPISLVGLAFWAASDSWRFTGGGLRYVVLVRGSTVDRLGFVAASGGPARYVVRLEEGTDPGAISVAYDSEALPGDVIGIYAERCLRLGIAVRNRQVRADAAEARLVCEGDAAVHFSDDVMAIAVRAGGAAITQVHITAGPGLVATYGFQRSDN